MGKAKNKSWIYDLIAAISVSLVALPISLALAKASGVSPIAGVISTVVGGIVMFFLGGSHVTITGPGNGLVLVIAASVGSIGYASTLTAIIVAGLLLIIFGFIKLGNLSDFFPASSIQGLLVAIGLTLILKQFHLMLGMDKPFSSDTSTFGIISYIPDMVRGFIQAPSADGILGVIGFLILFFYGFIKHKIVKFMPAPMWVVLIGVGFYYYYEFTGQEFPIASEKLLFIDTSELSKFNLPSIENISHSDFYVAVISITLICLIETLLSIKAVDKIDPEKRKSNFNKDLKGVGLATMISGLLGGLPVVTVIARSSVNVNQGAKSRLAGLFNAVFVALMILFLSQYLNKVPTSLLASILVFTGYKLAEPAKWRMVLKVGREQFWIFLITVVATLLTNLTNGIALGILATIVTQLSITKDLRQYLNSVSKPNVIFMKEDEDKYFIGVKGFSSFVNFLKLKKRLDQVPSKEHVILDFSMTEFVDHSVMEHIYNYANDYRAKGGDFEVIGLDVHDAYSPHPFAARGVKGRRRVSTKVSLTKRQKDIEQFASDKRWWFSPDSVYHMPNLAILPFYQTRKLDHAYNVVNGFHGDVEFNSFDVEYSEGELLVEESYRATMLLIQFENKHIPDFTLDRESIKQRVIELADKDHVKFKEHHDFSDRYHLEGADNLDIKRFFTDDLIDLFERNPYFHVESKKDQILIIKKERLASISEVRFLNHFAEEMVEIINKD